MATHQLVRNGIGQVPGWSTDFTRAPRRRRAHHRSASGHSLRTYVTTGNVGSLLTAPVIYSLILPLALLDLWVTVYQSVCFPIYGIARVPRRSFLVLDRHRLQYLNAIEKAHCTFCSYANGVLAYTQEIAACTEQYWCPIKHETPVPAPHRRYPRFVAYGDADAYRSRLPALRRALERHLSRRRARVPRF